MVSSPLRRAIQTACLAFAPALRRPHVEYLVSPLGQEANAFECDIGHDRHELQGLLAELLQDSDLGFDVAKINLGLVEDGWNSKVGKPQYLYPLPSLFLSLSRRVPP